MALRKQTGKSKGMRETDVSLRSQDARVQDVRHGFKSIPGVRPVRSDKVQSSSSIVCASGGPREVDEGIKKKMNTVQRLSERTVKWCGTGQQRDTPHVSVNSP